MKAPTMFISLTERKHDRAGEFLVVLIKNKGAPVLVPVK